MLLIGLTYQKTNMANAQQSYQLDSDQFIKGITTSSNMLDGGLSPESDSINLVVNPGVVYATASPVTISSSINGRVVSSCSDSSFGYAGANQVTKFILTDNYPTNNHGELYSLISGSLNSLGSFGSQNIYMGLSDMVVYGNISTDPTIMITTDTGINTVAYNYSTKAIDSSSSHSPSGWQTQPSPMVVFNKLLFYANGNYLHTYNSIGQVFTDAVLTLQTDQVITALDIDPGTGRLIVGVATRNAAISSSNAGGNGTTSFTSPCFIGLYDGVDPTQFLRKVPVDGPVTTFKNCGGKTYIFYGNCLGIWTGSGIQFLRRLYTQSQGVQFNNVYKCKVSNFDNFLLYVSNTTINNSYLNNTPNTLMAYGEVQAGIPAFFPLVGLPGSGSSTGTGLDFVDYAGQGAVIYSYNLKLYSVNLFSKSNVISTGDNSPLLVSKRIPFPGPVMLNFVRIFYEDSFNSVSSTFGKVSIVDDNRQIAYSESIPSTASEVGMTGSNGAWVDVKCQIKTTEIQILYQWLETSTNHGITKMIVFYTPYE
jgi:hypothetical protein